LQSQAALRKRSESEAKLTSSNRLKDIPVDIFTSRPEDGGGTRGRPTKDKVRKKGSRKEQNEEKAGN
jgi:hypothetical protein